jgi:hypothetical protein
VAPAAGALLRIDVNKSRPCRARDFTVTPPSGADHQWLEWSLDGITWNRVETPGRSAPVTVSVTPPSNGTRGLQVRSVDEADNPSEGLTCTFHSGPGGFRTPRDGQRTARRVVFAAESDAARFDAVSFLWRRSSTGPWTAIPPAHVTAAGQPVTSWPVPLANGKRSGEFPGGRGGGRSRDVPAAPGRPRGRDDPGLVVR